MRTIRALAPAKVNLTFDITGIMPDGYHSVETLLQAIDLSDEITLAIQESSEFSMSITCTNEILPRQFPTDDSNLMVKAARAYLTKVVGNDQFQIHIDIEKNIPIGAGLAGGSADAAAVLVALNDLFDRRADTNQLCELGRQLGADVPFCIVGGTQLGTARGDTLRPIKSHSIYSYCIVKPRAISVSTPWAYRQYDAFKQPIDKPHLHNAIGAVESGDLELAIRSFGNVFEPVILQAHPELVPIKQQLLKLGCWHCQLSGSGPALFALVANREQAHFIRRKVLKTDDLEFDYVRLSTPDLGPPVEFYIAQTAPAGVQIVESASK